MNITFLVSILVIALRGSKRNQTNARLHKRADREVDGVQGEPKDEEHREGSAHILFVSTIAPASFNLKRARLTLSKGKNNVVGDVDDVDDDLEDVVHLEPHHARGQRVEEGGLLLG